MISDGFFHILSHNFSVFHHILKVKKRKFAKKYSFSFTCWSKSASSSHLTARTVQRCQCLFSLHIFDWIYSFLRYMELTSTHKPLDYTRHLHHESSGYMRKQTLIPEPTSAPKDPQAPASTHKFPKIHQTPATWVLRPFKGAYLHRRAHKYRILCI